jgi:hypothetical protein
MYSENNSFHCYYPIFWLPPTIFHYNTAQILSNRGDISSIIIVIPNIKYDYLNQEQAAQLFQCYLNGSPLADVSIEKSSQKNALKYIKELYKGDPNMQAFVALDEKTARSSEFNRAFAPNEHLEIQIVPSSFEKSSQKMRDAIEEGDQQSFNRYLPAHLPDTQKKECWNIVHSEIQEQIVTRKYWDKLFESIFTLK